MISVVAVAGVVAMAAGMAFFAFGSPDGIPWNWRARAALGLIVVGLVLTIYFGVAR
jgi:hypothetical protein